VTSLLEVTGLKSGYGLVPILTGISIAVEAGEFVGILGHNGMGKTTLLRTLMGYLPATEGTIQFGGADLTRLATHQRARHGLGLVPQGREIFPTLTVLDNLRIGCAMSNRDEKAAVDVVLSDFPRLKRLLDRPGGALSGAGLRRQPRRRRQLIREGTHGIIRVVNVRRAISQPPITNTDR